MKLQKFLRLAAAIIITNLAGIIGSLFTSPAIPTWYATIVRPALNPPNWVFGPVWTTLFILMGIALFLVWEHNASKKLKRIAITFFAVQLVLNTLWSIIFFGMQNPMGAFIELCVLWIAILATIIAFYKISKPAAYLLLPYIGWVTFAGYLNFMIWRLN